MKSKKEKSIFGCKKLFKMKSKIQKKSIQKQDENKISKKAIVKIQIRFRLGGEGMTPYIRIGLQWNPYPLPKACSNESQQVSGSHFCDLQFGFIGKYIINNKTGRKINENLSRIHQNFNLEAMKSSFGQKSWCREPQNRFRNPKIGFGSASGAQKNQQGLALEALNRALAVPWGLLGGSWALLGKSIEKRPRGLPKMYRFGIPKSRPKFIKIDAKKHCVFRCAFSAFFQHF